MKSEKRSCLGKAVYNHPSNIAKSAPALTEDNFLDEMIKAFKNIPEKKEIRFYSRGELDTLDKLLAKNKK